MTRPITGLFSEQLAVNAAVEFLKIEYGIPYGDILICPADGQSGSGPLQLTVDVNDDEVADISEALAAMGAALTSRA